MTTFEKLVLRALVALLRAQLGKGPTGDLQGADWAICAELKKDAEAPAYDVERARGL